MVWMSSESLGMKITIDELAVGGLECTNRTTLLKTWLQYKQIGIYVVTLRGAMNVIILQHGLCVSYVC